MVTLLRQNGFEFIIRTRDHAPAHIHVKYGREEVLFNLGLNGELPSIRDIRGMSRQNIKKVFEITIANNDEFLRRWQEIYG